MTNNAMLADSMARLRAAEREEFEEEMEARRERRANGEPEPDLRYRMNVYSARELGMLRRRVQTGSDSMEDFQNGVHEPSVIEYESFFPDLFAHLRQLPRTAYIFLKSPALIVMSLLMLAGHVTIACVMAFGGMDTGNDTWIKDYIVFSAIANGIILTWTAFSPLLSTSDHKRWRWVGGMPRKVEGILMIFATIPAMIGLGILFNAVEPLLKVLIGAVIVTHLILPFVIRKIASRKVRNGIWEAEYLIEHKQKQSEVNFVTDLLRQKVIGEPGAALETSAFSAGNVAAGVAGERKTAAVLDAFARRHNNTVVFHSVRWNTKDAMYDIDHVVVINETVFFLDSKQWSDGDYLMHSSGNQVTKNGQQMPNGDLHIQAGADTYLNSHSVLKSSVQIVVWTNGTLSNASPHTANLVDAVTLESMLEHEQSIQTRDGITPGFNPVLMESLYNNTVTQ